MQINCSVSLNDGSVSLNDCSMPLNICSVSLNKFFSTANIHLFIKRGNKKKEKFVDCNILFLYIYSEYNFLFDI